MAISPPRAISPSSSSARSSSADPSDREEARAVKRRKVEFEESSAARGQASNSVFTAPKGLKKAAADESLGEFDAEIIKQKLANGCQLWAIRIPDGVKLRHLSDVQLANPGKTGSTQKLGQFKGKKAEYEIFSLGTDADAASSVGAGEMRSLTALLADKKKKYTAAPTPIARHLVIRQAINFPPPLDIPLEDIVQDEDAEQMQVKHEQPDGLKGFFAPAGFDTTAPATRASSPSKKKKAKKDKSDTQPAAIDEEAGDSSPAKKERKEKKKKRKSEANGAGE